MPPFRLGPLRSAISLARLSSSSLRLSPLPRRAFPPLTYVFPPPPGPSIPPLGLHVAQGRHVALSVDVTVWSLPRVSAKALAYPSLRLLGRPLALPSCVADSTPVPHWSSRVRALQSLPGLFSPPRRPRVPLHSRRQWSRTQCRNIRSCTPLLFHAFLEPRGSAVLRLSLAVSRGRCCSSPHSSFFSPQSTLAPWLAAAASLPATSGSPAKSGRSGPSSNPRVRLHQSLVFVAFHLSTTAEPRGLPTRLLHGSDSQPRPVQAVPQNAASSPPKAYEGRGP